MLRPGLFLLSFLFGAASAQSIQGVTWTLSRVGNLSDPGATLDLERNDPPTLRLENGRASGFAGCNAFGGTYSLRGSVLSVTASMSTRKACESAVHTMLEGRFLRDLERVNVATLSGGLLVLTTEDGLILAFRRAP